MSESIEQKVLATQLHNKAFYSIQNLKLYVFVNLMTTIALII